MSNDLSHEAAWQILEFKFSDAEIARMHELAAKNQEGTITSAETVELDAYISVGDKIAILQSKARKALRQAP
jgi:hypothetical protein